MQITHFNGIELHLQEHQEFEFLLSNKEVADGYGTTIALLSQAKSNHSDELIENKHFVKLEVMTNGGKQKVIHWTKRGIIRLGFFIKSEQAKRFRDFIEDLILSIPQKQISTYNGKRVEFVIGGYMTVVKKLSKSLKRANRELQIARDLMRQIQAQKSREDEQIKALEKTLSFYIGVSNATR